MAVHPVAHPETGQQALCVNEHSTRRLVEMVATESKAVLEYLIDWVKTHASPCALSLDSWAPLPYGTIAAPNTLCSMTLKASASFSASR